MSSNNYDQIQDPSGVHSLDHFALSVPDLDEACRFFLAFGLDVRRVGDVVELRAHGSDQCWAVLNRAPRKALSHISFGAFAEDLDGFRSALREQGIETSPIPEQPGDRGFRFHDPHGLLVEIRVSKKNSPDNKARISEPPAVSALRGAPLRDNVEMVRPKRLSHILIFTPNIEQAIAFYTSVLGLRLSDSSGPVAFLHGRHGSDHHLLAFAKSTSGTGYHHSAWEVGSISEVGLGAMQMAEKGYTKGWGLGRHVLGSNYFHYVRDPWGSYAEFSCGIDYVPAGAPWEPSRPSAENSLYLWGPPPPEDFTVNYEA